MSDSLVYPIRSDKLSINLQFGEHLAHRKTPYQTIDIYETPALGRVLFLDGHVQLAELDEFAYHEALVHIPALSMKSPKRALIVGGGDGAVARELCRIPSLETIDFCEIDAEVIELCREHLPFLSTGVWDDPRVQLHLGDAFEFVKEAREPYDLIVMDSTDVYEEEEGELSERLWTDAFFRDLYRLLTPQGVVMTQADNLVFCAYSLDGILDAFRPIFPKVGSYWAIVPSFGGFSGYAWASKMTEVGPDVDASWLAAYGLRYLNPVTLALAFQPHPFVRFDEMHG